MILKQFILTFIFIMIMSSVAGADTCNDCHSALSKEEAPAFKHDGWLGSIHEKNNIGCSKCHGGLGAEKTKKESHKGVKHSSDRKSKLYYNRIPLTCGKCHLDSQRLLINSNHYKRIETSGTRLECVTCHGAIGSKLIGAEKLYGLCRSCHIKRLKINPKVPDAVKLSMMLLEEAKTAEQFADLLVKSSGIHSAGDLENRLKVAGQFFKSAAGSWHSFQISGINKNTYEAFKSVRSVVNALMYSDDSLVDALLTPEDKEVKVGEEDESAAESPKDGAKEDESAAESPKNGAKEDESAAGSLKEAVGGNELIIDSTKELATIEKAAEAAIKKSAKPEKPLVDATKEPIGEK